MYILVDEASGEAAVVDPYDAPKIHAAAAEQGVKVSRWWQVVYIHH